MWTNFIVPWFYYDYVYLAYYVRNLVGMRVHENSEFISYSYYLGCLGS